MRRSVLVLRSRTGGWLWAGMATRRLVLVGLWKSLWGGLFGWEFEDFVGVSEGGCWRKHRLQLFRTCRLGSDSVTTFGQG